MEWLQISGVIIGLMAIVGVVLWFLMDGRDRMDMALFMSLTTFVLVLVFGFGAAGLAYYTSKGNARHAESYYDNLIAPNIVAEYEDYVVVDSDQAALWQAGRSNLSTYNAYLKSRRYWDGVPIIGSLTYAPPEHLKYVRVQ